MDKQYLQKVLAGDSQAFRYFVREYQDMAFSISMSITRSELLSEEAVQDAFVKAFQNIRKFKGKSKFSTWFYRIVVNESLRKVQRKKLATTDDNKFKAEENLQGVDDSFRALHELEQKEIVLETLAKLPETESLMLKLYYLDENKVEEVSEISGLSQANVKVILHRARLRFYKCLQASYKHEMNSLL